ncbi:MAG TPA: pyrroloquinoline quinone precursor peptide PqqA [Methylibium sp.]
MRIADLPCRGTALLPWPLNPERRLTMLWTKPQYQDLRFGFEITMYISAR